jgi:hypothetical protein
MKTDNEDLLRYKRMYDHVLCSQVYPVSVPMQAKSPPIKSQWYLSFLHE